MILLVVLLQLLKVVIKDVHNGIHLGSGALPVLGREGVDRNGLEAHLATVLANGLEGIRAGLVTVLTGLPPLLGPTAVAVHDKGDMAKMLVNLGSFGGRLF